MTREEQIHKVASTYLTGNSDLTASFIEAFEDGAKWADNHPKYQWISVEEDLPCKHPQLLEKVNYTQTVLVVLSWNDDPTKKHIETAYMCNRIGPFDVNWYWENRAHYHVTHWMLLPELPKE